MRLFLLGLLLIKQARPRVYVINGLLIIYYIHSRSFLINKNNRKGEGKYEL